MNTPLTDAVDAASYPSGAAHREALRQLCHKLEAEKLRLLGQIATMHDEREATEARLGETERQRQASELANMGLRAKLADREERLRAVTEAGRYLRDSLDAQVNRRTRAYDPDADRAAIARWDAARTQAGREGA